MSNLRSVTGRVVDPAIDRRARSRDRDGTAWVGCGAPAERPIPAPDRRRVRPASRAALVGTALDAANVRRAFHRVVAGARLNREDWTPRELRHSFVSILSDEGMTIEKIAELCGHADTRVTEQVYRK
jgi:integrase